MCSRENSLSLLALSSESSESSWVALDINAGLLFEVNHAVVDELVVEVLTTQVSMTVGGLDLEDTLLDGKERDIEGTTSKIEDEDVSLLGLLTIKTVSDGGSGWLVIVVCCGEALAAPASVHSTVVSGWGACGCEGADVARLGPRFWRAPGGGGAGGAAGG